MKKWELRKVKNFEVGLFFGQAFLVFFSWILGIFAYDAGTLMQAIPDCPFFLTIAIICIYGYLFLWSCVGFMMTITSFVWLANFIYRYPRRRELRAERERQRLLAEQDNINFRNDEVYERFDSLTLNEKGYNPFLHDAAKECTICMEPFSENQKVIALPCDKRHYFHSDCILDWSKRHRNCPLCKKAYNASDIKKFNRKYVKIAEKADKERRNSIALSQSQISLETIEDDSSFGEIEPDEEQRLL